MDHAKKTYVDDRPPARHASVPLQHNTYSRLSSDATDDQA